LANHKSAIKRIRQTAKRTERNKHERSTLRTFIKRVREAVATKDQAAAQAALAIAIPVIDGAATKGIIHSSNASRNVSRLTKLVNTLSA
jgi:small subunit ribosomal protein S20